MSGLDGVNPELVRRFLSLQSAAAAQGFNIGVGSGVRSASQQAALRKAHCCYDANSSKCSCGPPTAPVGSSNHQTGFAIDVAASKAAKAWMGAHAAEFGLHLPVNGEDWHLEMIGDAGSQGFMAAGIGTPFDINMDTGPTKEEREDQMVQSFLDAMVGAQRDTLLESPTDPLLETPAAPEAESPALAQEFTPDQLQPELQMQEVTVGGQPGAQPDSAGGRWQGNIPPPGYVPPGSGVGRWRDVALAALRYTGQDPAMVDLLLKRMAQESSGNERAVNNWDINAKRGDPSKGLMQNIGSAFPERARELAGRGIYDGFANIVASIRYTLNRYGSLAKGWARRGGY